MAAEPLDTPARSRFNQLHREVRERICLLIYPPGMTLFEEQLADEFKVSRSPIRRVLSRLEADGLVEIVHGVGTIVIDLDADRLKDAYDLRLGLLGLFGQMAVAEVSSDIVDRFGEVEKKLRSSKEDLTAEDLSRLNMTTADMTLELIANTAYRDVIERLYYQTSRFMMQSIDGAGLAEEIDVFHREVKDMLLALKAGDLDAFGKMRQSHVSQSYIRMSLSQQETAGKGT